MKHITEYLMEGFKEIFEERAAIIEYDGQKTREEAEELARREVEEARKEQE
jgi:hypothetical protein